jgi:hypothetical protein
MAASVKKVVAWVARRVAFQATGPAAAPRAAATLADSR